MRAQVHRIGPHRYEIIEVLGSVVYLWLLLFHAQLVLATEDAKEGPRAFMEKRQPRYVGR